MSGQPAIVATDLSFSYGDHRAVDGVTFAVAPGEILGFLGPNGAGKSTTIKMLTGQLAPGGGTVEVLGLPMPARRTEIQSRIGVCFEEKNLYPAMSAAENLRFFARLFGIRGFDPAPLLERVGLAERAKDRVSDFSKGMRQRLMMARALVNTPDVLFLDEPTDGLDPVSARTIRALVVEETRRGAAVLLTTHDMVEADELSDRVAFINAGRVLVLDTPERLKLAHGERSVRVRSLGSDGAVAEHLVLLDAADTAERIGAAVRAGEVLTVHTEEATLEDIFVLYAGRGLAS
ncbi:ABC transporter ATP-binding protein [Georgenia muralis]|uniref:ABC-2 type transport system ATP-binding protein n=1 Tax=Georgenia muralis TaxID=154117 RepID=A0A3N4ZAP0_9MICO|nr:ABC transporter ATP-binding protein [Georgenia muralis]RPF29144.1 ABC-2 type transport system ATP-binding protein [Georgenia muralis]